MVEGKGKRNGEFQKVEELGRFSIYRQRTATRDAYHLRWWEPLEQRQKSRKLGGRTLAEVRSEALSRIQTMISADDIIESADPYFREVWILYQTRQMDRITPERLHLNKLRWPLYYEKALGDVRCSRITPALVALKDQLLKLKKKDGKTRKLSPNTVDDIVGTARAAVEYARSMGSAKVPEVPRIEVAGTVAPRDGRTPKGRIISLEEMGALVDAAATDKAGRPGHPHVLHAMLTHIASAGRSGAIFDLTIPQVLWDLGIFDLRPYQASEDRKKPRGIAPISGPMPWVLREGCATAGRDLRVIHYRGMGIGGNATQIIFRIRQRAQLDGKPLNLDRLNWYSIRHTIANWLRDYVAEGYISAMLGHSIMVPIQDRWRMHELCAAQTTRQNYFDNHPENREIGRQKRKLSYLYDIRDAMDEHFWPALQRHCKTDLRLGAADRRCEADVAAPFASTN